MNRKIKVGVLYGGISSEREVSINSGKQISESLNKDKYEVSEILLNDKSDVFKCKDLDFVFIALHGIFGEDGQVQSILDALGIKYNGCGFHTSSICMNKFFVKNILSRFGIEMAKGIILNRGEFNLRYLEEHGLEFPVIVKPNSGGSSLGVYLCKNDEELFKNIMTSFEFDEEVLVEEFIEGQEISCGILNDEVLPLFNITPKNDEIFSYESKYDNSTLEEPSNFDLDLDLKIKQTALKCYNILNCRVYSRVDFIVKDEIPYFLEVNTLPGMTKESLFPKMSKIKGIEFSDLLDIIIESSMRDTN